MAIGPALAKGCGAGRSDAGGRTWLTKGRCAGNVAERSETAGVGVLATNRPAGEVEVRQGKWERA